MDGIEVSTAAQKASKAAAASSETSKTVKLTIAIVGLLVGGALIVWNLMPTSGVDMPSGNAASSSSGAPAAQAPGNQQGANAASSTSGQAAPLPPSLKSGPRSFTR